MIHVCLDNLYLVEIAMNFHCFCFRLFVNLIAHINQNKDQKILVSRPYDNIISCVLFSFRARPFSHIIYSLS